jgi:DNA-binding MarR family transcriptional regulator
MKSIKRKAESATRRAGAEGTGKRHSPQANGLVKFGPLPGYLGYQIRQAQVAIFRDLSASTSALNITPGEYGLLSLLDANPGISQIALAQVYGLDKSTLSLAVSRLGKRGLVRRTRSPKDGRYYTLWLTRAGTALLARFRAHVEAQEKTMDMVLRPGERAQMLDMLKRISRVFNR